MKTLILIALVSAAAAQYPQFRQSEVQAPVQVVHADMEEEPSKFSSLIPDWETPLMLNYTEMFDSVNEKLAALDNLDVSSGFPGNGSFSVGTAFAPVTALISWTGNILASTASSAYSVATTFAFPIMVTVVFYAGIFYLVQMALQVRANPCLGNFFGFMDGNGAENIRANTSRLNNRFSARMLKELTSLYSAKYFC